mmetsp:Transcript_17758/g.44770  ORF Transcript_17758/g.44770 Transcript_17758/m.44770 type:complete len:254 (-) Transcript_17758:536-1297(-)
MNTRVNDNNASSLLPAAAGTMCCSTSCSRTRQSSCASPRSSAPHTAPNGPARTPFQRVLMCSMPAAALVLLRLFISCSTNSSPGAKRAPHSSGGCWDSPLMPKAAARRRCARSPSLYSLHKPGWAGVWGAAGLLPVEQAFTGGVADDDTTDTCPASTLATSSVPHACCSADATPITSASGSTPALQPSSAAPSARFSRTSSAARMDCFTCARVPPSTGGGSAAPRPRGVPPAAAAGPAGSWVLRAPLTSPQGA